MVKKYSNFSFTGHFKIFAVISIILIAVGLVSLLLLPFGVKLFNFDIDFLGGTTMQYELHTDVTADVTSDIEQIVKDTSGSAPSSVTRAGDSGTQVVIKMLEVDSNTRDAIFNAVPAPIFSVEQLKALRPDCFYIELASSPGGISPDALKPAHYIPAPGLPGRTAPKTAAQFIFRAMCDSPYLSQPEVL